jgi:hypothetical protein
MEGRFLLNGNSITYLIQGQPFELLIQGIGCRWVVIHYADGASLFWNWHIRRADTVFRSTTNIYRPLIRVWGIGWGIRKLLHKHLHINFMNVREQDLRPNAPLAARRPDMSSEPMPCTLIPPAWPSRVADCGPLRGNVPAIAFMDDYERFKSAYPSHPNTTSDNG